MTDHGYLTAPDGPIPADVRLAGIWPWLVVALGAVLIVAGALLLS